jgi:DNA-binding NarL/FixJ family response regulator
MSLKKSVKVLIADDHELVRDGIRARLEDETNIDIVGDASNGKEAIELIPKVNPDLILLDINMPEMNGFETLEQMRKMELRQHVLYLSLYDNKEYVRRAKALGANGYMLKDVSQEEMISTIYNASAGGFWVNTSLDDSLNEPVSEMPVLTEREQEILAAIARGKLNKQIAGELNISVRTVESHRSAIRQKTGGGNAASLAKIASDLGLL